MSSTNDLATHLGGVPVGGVPYSYLKGPSGKVLFVAPFRTAGTASSGTRASDTNPGTLAYPLKTIAKAYSLCTGGLGEIIYVLGYSNTAADITDDWSAGVTWSKNAVHLIGLAPQHYFSHRARINQTSTATGISPLLNVTGNNNVFANLQIFQGVDDATSLVAVQITGQRNVFDNVHIAGIGHATMVAAGAASLKIDGGAENYFRACTIGLDSITRDNNCREIWFDTAATRNVFEDCLIDAFISNAGYCWVKVNDSTAIDRSLIFKNCLFMSKSANKATTQTSGFDIPAISQGAIVLQNSKGFSDGGAVDWDSNNRGIIWNDSVAAAATAGGGILTNQ